MPVPACVSVLILVSASVAFGEPVLVEPVREGMAQAPDPANYVFCRWGSEPHRHGPAVSRGGVPGNSTTLIQNGSSANRIDLVVVGDGYTAGDLGTYAVHALNGVNDLFTTPPFDVYQELFNVHRVDVISNESGVDNDPDQGISRDTALNMRFWCGGTERALCVDVGLAISAAQNAPDWDQVFAIANSSKYGGVGYPSSDVGTFAGGNASAPQVAIHELGHALGNLADEYTYDGPETYSGSEPSAKNVSTFDAGEQTAMGLKWHNWLGVDDPDFDGLVDTYEGGNYSVFGIYRPTDDSMMRNLGREFNLPSVEGMIIEMWKSVSPIDLHTSTASELSRFQTVIAQPAASFVTARWYLDDELIRVGPGQLNLTSVDLPIGTSTLRVVVSDETTLVRDEIARQLYMTQERVWTIGGITADYSGDGVINGVDLAILLAAWGAPGADINGDGTTDAGDLAILLASWG